MLIRVKEGQVIAGPGVEALPDGTHDVPDDVGAAIVEAGHAEYAGPDPSDGQGEAKAPRKGKK